MPVNVVEGKSASGKRRTTAGKEKAVTGKGRPHRRKESLFWEKGSNTEKGKMAAGKGKSMPENQNDTERKMVPGGNMGQRKEKLTRRGKQHREKRS